MPMSTDAAIAAALLGYLEAQLRAGTVARAFFRLEGFSAASYAHLLDALAAQGGQLAGRPLTLRSIDAIPGHPDTRLEPERSATWYRNHLPPDHALVLILNRRVTDGQSLKDLFPVGEASLARDGLPALLDACIRLYQLSPQERQVLADFVRRYRRARFEPQLRDLAEFLVAVDEALGRRPDAALPEAIAESLPLLGLFRCRDLAELLNSSRGDRLIQQLGEAARIGEEVLDERVRGEYLARLNNVELADDRAFGGPSAHEKRALLLDFIDGRLAENRDALLRVLRIDWREVQLVITARSRQTRDARLAKLGERLQGAAEQAGIGEHPELADVVTSLREGREPEGEQLDRLLVDASDGLGRALRNDLRRLVRPRTRRSADLLAGLTALAVELLHPIQAELPASSTIRVSLAPRALDRRARLVEAAAVFHAVYGGVERVMPAVQWALDPLLDARHGEAADEASGEERERVAREEIALRVAIIAPDSSELAVAELIWQYRSDSPAAATAQTLAAEAARLGAQDRDPRFAGDGSRLAVPIYTSCPPLDEIGDLDLRRPLHSLGAWYEHPDDLRVALEAQLRPRARPEAWTALDAALMALERAWAAFVAQATAHGLFGADINGLLAAYEDLLATATRDLRTGTEVSLAFRLLNQAWIIGPPSFSTWALMPLLHPLKLLWWRERARTFDGLLRRLLAPATPAPIVDVRRFRQDLPATYGSSGFPPVLALPPGEGLPAQRFLAAEEAEGYELFFQERAGVEAYGLDPDLLAEDENELAALRAVDGITAVVQDYIETYPFVRDGVEILLFECRNGALPGLLIEQLAKISQRRSWSVRLSVIVHTSEHGAPLFRRVSAWVAGERPLAERKGQDYFPPVTVQVLQCSQARLFERHEDADIVVLADVLAGKGQEVRSELEPADDEPVSAIGYLPTYRARQEPFQQGEQFRRILLSAPQQPELARLFLLSQHAALDRRPLRPGHEARFYRELSLEPWHATIARLHERFNWVVCYDTSIDRFLLESAFPDQVQVIRYSLGLGAKRQHNLTVSSSGRAQQIVTRRLAARLGQLFPQAAAELRTQIAARLVAEAKQISGDIVLRAAGPGAFLHELIGLVAARFATEQRQSGPALITWILLDDFEHWFSGKFPDLLRVVIAVDTAGELALRLQVIEAKCVGELSFAAEAADAQIQVRNGVGRLAQAFAPGNQQLDALFWYDQLYRAVAGNLAVALEQQPLWELFRDRLHTGRFALDMSGHSWIFCYDGQATATAGPDERPFTLPVEDAPQATLLAHHYGRNELAALLGALIHARGGPALPAETWVQPAPELSAAQQPDDRPISVPLRSGELHAAPPPQHGDAGQLSPPEPQPPPDQPLPSQPQPTVEAPLAEAQSRWLAEKARELEQALRRRGVQVQRIDPQEADVGPSIVRFKLRLTGNETIRRLQSAAIDLARDLSLTSTPFIDNVLGTNFVGVDLPRDRPETVELLPLLRALGRPAPAELPTIIGKTPDGRLHIEDLAEFPHLLVAGATGSGKSVFLRSVLLGLLTQYLPGQVELLIVDPKQTDFSFFDSVPHLRGGKVFTQAEEARDALLELVRSEMPRRQQLMRGRSLKIKEFNRRFPAEALPPIVAMIDEYAQLLSIMPKREQDGFERDLMSLAAVARSTGIHLILATQRPSVNVVTGTLKANLPSRIAFQVPTNQDSRVVLDASGAENLLGRGDMLFRKPSGEILRLQAPFMDEEAMQSYLAALIP